MNKHEHRRVSAIADYILEVVLVSVLEEARDNKSGGMTTTDVVKRANQILEEPLSRILQEPLKIDWWHCNNVALPRLAENGEIRNDAPGPGGNRWVLD